MRPIPNNSSVGRQVARTAVRGLSQMRSWPAWLFAALLAASQLAGSHIVFVGDPEALSLGPNYLTAWSWSDLAMFAIAVPLCAFLLMTLVELADSGRLGQHLHHYSHDDLRSPRRFIGVRMALLLLAWLPYMLAYFPGGIAQDSLAALAQGPGRWDAADPLAFTFLVKAFLSLGIAVGSPNLGIFASTVAHSVAMAAVLSYGVLILARLGAPTLWCWATVGYFAFAPAFPIFAITMLKDVPFALAIVGLTYYTLAVVQSEGALLSRPRGVWIFLALAVLCIALRNNGIYVIALTVVAFFGAYRTQALRVAGVVSTLLLAAALLTGPGYRALDIENDRAASESMGVPLQGVASVIAGGGDIAPTEKAFLDRLLPWAMWSELYRSAVVDPIKASDAFDKDYLNTHVGEFIATWAKIAIRNPGTMLGTYVLGTFGYWKISHDHPYLGPYLAPNEELGLYQVDLVAMFTGQWVSPTLTWIWAHTPGRGGGFPAEGIFTWAMLAALALLAIEKRFELMLVLVPCLAVWLTIMIAAPVAYGLRFLLALAMCAPGFLLLPFSHSDDETGERPQEVEAPVESSRQNDSVAVG